MGVWEDCETTYATNETNKRGPHAPLSSGADTPVLAPLLFGWSKKKIIYNGVNSVSVQF